MKFKRFRPIPEDTWDDMGSICQSCSLTSSFPSLTLGAALSMDLRGTWLAPSTAYLKLVHWKCIARKCAVDLWTEETRKKIDLSYQEENGAWVSVIWCFAMYQKASWISDCNCYLQRHHQSQNSNSELLHDYSKFLHWRTDKPLEIQAKPDDIRDETLSVCQLFWS